MLKMATTFGLVIRTCIQIYSIVELDRLNTVINHLKLKLNPKTELWELSTFFCHHRISLDKII